MKKLQDYITANYYTCTKNILSGLGQMYAAAGEMTENIDAAGEGTLADIDKYGIAPTYTFGGIRQVLDEIIKEEKHEA